MNLLSFLMSKYQRLVDKLFFLFKMTMRDRVILDKYIYIVHLSNYYSIITHNHSRKKID